MIATLIVVISQHLLMNNDDSIPVIMSMPSTETLLDCSDSWGDWDSVGYECMSRSWGRGFEVSIIPVGPSRSDVRF